MSNRKEQSIKILLTVLLSFAYISIAASPSLAAPDVDVTDIYTPTSLIALQDTTVTAELTNYGDAGININNHFYKQEAINGQTNKQ